jgi:galactokinase
MRISFGQIKKQFCGIFGNASLSLIVRSPGRVNLIGEHTDYNEGFVLPAAIDKVAYIAMTLRNDDEMVSSPCFRNTTAKHYKFNASSSLGRYLTRNEVSFTHPLKDTVR